MSRLELSREAALEAVRGYRIPDFTLPFPEVCNDFADSACRDGEDWVARTGLFPDPAVRARLMAARTGDLAALAMPYAGESMTLLLNHWILWTLELDEFLEALPFEVRVRAWDETLGECAAVLDGAAPSNPITAALAEMWAETVEPMSCAWIARFKRNTLRFVDAERVKSVRHAATSPPSIAEYIAERRHAFWCYAAMDLVERGRLFEVPQVVYDSEPYQVLYESGADIAGWTNDIFSAPGELVKGELLTFPGLLMNERGYSFQQAALETVARIYVRICDFLRGLPELRRLLDELRVPRDVRDGVLECADGIATWLVANHAWHRRSSRYPVWWGAGLSWTVTPGSCGVSVHDLCGAGPRSRRRRTPAHRRRRSDLRRDSWAASTPPVRAPT